MTALPGFQVCVRGEIKDAATKKTGIDVPGIPHVIYLEAPHSLVDYDHETGCAGRSRERVTAEIIVKDKD